MSTKSLTDNQETSSHCPLSQSVGERSRTGSNLQPAADQTMNPVRDKTGLPLVVAVVLTWNDTAMTSDCISSLLKSDYPNLRIILVDNGSAQPCGRIVQERFPEIELITLDSNRGFSGGSNRGIERAQKLLPNYILLVGNDSTLDPTAVSSLVDALEKDPNAGIASPLLLYPDENRTVQFFTATIDRDVALHHNHDYPVSVESRAWSTVRSDFVPFVAPMFRSSALKNIGLLDESYSTCWEDYDLCLRFLDGGWRIITVGEARAVHLGSQTTGIETPYIVYYTTRNRLICLARYANRLAMIRRAPYLLRSFLWRIRKHGLLNWPCHKAFFMGWLDFLRGVRGPGWGSTVPPRKGQATNLKSSI